MSRVVTMNIKDPEVHRLATALAQRRGVSMTAAVRAALEETIERERVDRDSMAERLMEISRRSIEDAEKYGWPPMLTDADMYDENGLPR